MKFGVQVRATAEDVDPVLIARELEWRGFESIFFPEHTHVPVSRVSEHPGGVELMGLAMRGFDPLTAMAFAAAATFKLRVGTGVCLLPQHDPIVFAKAISTLDVLSRGRVVLGVGAGWAREEMANHGVAPETRWAMLREKVLALKAIWTQQQPEFHGDYVSFDSIYQWPKPLQSPHPPVLLGLDGPSALRRVLDYGDGWMPNFDPDTLDRVAELQRMAVEVGRGPVPVTAYSVPPDVDVVGDCVEAGIERVVFVLPATDMAILMSTLDELSELIGHFAEGGSDAAG